MSGRWKGIILNIMVPGVGFMAQNRWGWGFFYLLIALVLLLPTFGVGYLVMGIIASIHSGAIGDAKHELNKKDIERIAAASASVAATVQKSSSTSVMDEIKK